MVGATVWDEGESELMKIAVMLGGVGYDSQKRTINGILDRALIDRANIFIFTCVGWRYESPSKYAKGESNIYTLPDFSEYDGVIMNSDTIQDMDIVEQIENRIQEAGIPCVDLNSRGGRFMSVEMENRIAMEEITHHLIMRHHAKNIYYISGPVYSVDAGIRLQAHQETMMANHIGWDKNHIYYGDYSFESGRRAVRKFLSEARETPDAIMAANDEMAVGAIVELREEGYCVPEDVMVTGYDDSEITEYNYPRLTTARRGEYEAGQLAYEKIAAALHGEEVQQHTVIQGKAVFAGSCGCDFCMQEDLTRMQMKFINSYVHASRDTETLRNCSADFTGLRDLDDLLGCLEHYIRSIDMEYFYFCMCGNLDEYYEEMERVAAGEERARDITVYSDKIWVPFAYEKGEVTSYGEFHRSLLLPEECVMRRSGAFYTIMPLHFQDYCFGYCVAGNHRMAFEGRFYQDFVLSLDNALETIRKQDVMRAMVRRLDHMWISDELTGIYNRSGFSQCAEQMIDEAGAAGKSVGVIFADVDDLSKVNGTYGHETGDALIKVMASIMVQSQQKGELISRYGGDEFAVLVTGYSKKDMENKVLKIRRMIDNYNLVHVKPYILSTSLGYCLEENAQGIEVNDLLKQAYEAMYAEKEKKKAGEEKNGESDTDGIEEELQLFQEESMIYIEPDII